MDKQVFTLLKTWCDALCDRQIKELHDPHLAGGILCPACGILHGRSGDLVYPLTLLYRETKEDKYRAAAMAVSDWTERNMKNAHGLYHNDFNADWYGIAAFSSDSLFEAISVSKNALPEKDLQTLTERFLAQTDRIYEIFSQPFFKPVTNYYAGTAAAMAERYVLTKEEKFKTLALEKLDHCFASVTADGLVYGENTSREKTSPLGYAAVDLGYDIEETIPFMIKTSLLLQLPERYEQAKTLMKTALSFLLPDGGLDNAWGSRSAKWTYYGSRTSDGMQTGLVLCPEEPLFREAAYRNFLCMQKQTNADGLLTGGAMYEEAGEPACTHHAFSHAKALAAMCVSDMDFSHACALPAETRRGLEAYPSAGVLLFGTEKLLASVYVGDVCYSPKLVSMGGSLSLLYARAFGPILAATQGRFTAVEPKNMQFRHDDAPIRCMTPRIEQGPYSTVFVRTFRSAYTENSVTVRGKLTDFADAPLAGGAYEMTYTFADDSLTFTLFSEHEASFILPVIASFDDTVSLSGSSAVIRRRGGTVTVTAEKDLHFLMPEDNESSRGFNPCGGFLYTELCLPLTAGKTHTCTISVREEQP